MTPRILFLAKQRVDTYGISYGLVNSAAFIVKTLHELKIDARIVTVSDANGIDREVCRYRPTHVVIEAIWVTPQKFRELLAKHKYRIWINRVHSKAPFIANEGIAFPWLAEYKKLRMEFPNLFVSCNSKEFNENLNATLDIDSIYLPNVYNPPKYKKVHNPEKLQPVINADGVVEYRPVIDIACFGAVRPMKNQLIQAIAAIRFGNDMGMGVNFHVNGGRYEQSGENVMKNLRALFAASPQHQLVEHAWLPHNEFLGLVRTMDLGMQVSFSETFNIVAADFVSQNVPLIVSPDIEWMPKLFKANPNCADSMVRKLKLAYYGSFFGLHYLSRLALWGFNLSAKAHWYNYVKESWLTYFLDGKFQPRP